MDDRARVGQLLGREPQGAFDVVVRDAAGDPVVIRNAPFLADGTPMPTRYYLVAEDLVREVSRLEAAGGVRDAESAVDAAEIAALHERYAADRDAAIPADHVGSRPSGGVGGTRVGVKCLHAHVAYALAGGDDAVGRWALDQLAARGTTPAGRAAAHPARGTTPAGRAAAHPAERPGRAVNPEPGGLTVLIEDERVGITMTGGASWSLPLGPATLVARQLERADPPGAIQLTNALGAVHDHFEDVVNDSPAVLATPSVVAVGPHADALARVEIGDHTVPAGYRLRRADAEEVFRTLVGEASEQRRFNPGLPDDHVQTIVGTCCVVLAIMRRLDLADLEIAAGCGGAAQGDG